VKKLTKILIGISVIGGAIFLYHSGASLGTRTAIFFGAIVIYLFYTTNQRLRKVESALGLLNDPTKEEETKKPVSFRVSVSINVKWIEIIKWCFPDLKTDDQVGDFVKTLYNDPDLELKKGEGLFQESFSFVEFCDGLSGINQIWSDYHKTFRDNMEIRGYIFEGSLRLYQRFPENKIGTGFRVRPDFIGFESILPDGDLMEKDKISQIPFYDMIEYFNKIHVNPDSSKNDANKFPKTLQDKFDKYGVKCETWTDDFGLGGNHFVTPYYSISLDMTFFD
jgi:hypothetical protein